MDNVIYAKNYEAEPFDKREILRYAGVVGDTHEFDLLLEECINEAEKSFVYKVCFREFEIRKNGDMLDLGFYKTDSQNLRKNLEGCKSIVLFAATVGIGIDRLVARYSSISPTKALIFQAIGAERIESLCDTFDREIIAKKESEGFVTCPRFSAGYGDFPLDAQRSIFAVLDVQKRIGLTLNESLLMSPSKSVTAIIGVRNK